MVLHFLKMFSKILCSAVSSTPAYAVLYRVLIITLEHHEGNNGVSNILSEGHLLGKRLQNRLVFTYIRLLPSNSEASNDFTGGDICISE